MLCVQGKRQRQLSQEDVRSWASQFARVTLDLGTGDGRLVRRLAQSEESIGAIGLDLCAANLRAASRAAPSNALFVVADALALPRELYGIADRVTIHFPWGSLLRGLLAGHDQLMAGLTLVGKANLALEIAINAGALAEEGYTLDDGQARVVATLREAGFQGVKCRELDAAALRRWPTSWAKRLAFGRDPRAISLTARHPRSNSRLPTPDSRVLQLAAGRHDAGLLTLM